MNLLPFITLALAVLVNSISVLAQKNYKFYDRFKNGHALHSYLIGPFWVLFILSLGGIESTNNFNFWTYQKYLGYALSALAITIFALALKQIGSGGLNNANFFGGSIKQLRGIYNYVPEPIYFSYVLAVAAQAFIHNDTVWLLLASETFVLLCFVESKAEAISS